MQRKVKFTIEAQKAPKTVENMERVEKTRNKGSQSYLNKEDSFFGFESSSMELIESG